MELPETGRYAVRVLGSLVTRPATYNLYWLVSRGQGRHEVDSAFSSGSVGANNSAAGAEILVFEGDGTGAAGFVSTAPRVGQVDPGDEDWYEVYVTAGDAVSFEVVGEAGLAPRVSLVDETGLELVADENVGG